MDIVHTRCCGLDNHKKRVGTCLIVSELGQHPTKETRTVQGSGQNEVHVMLGVCCEALWRNE